MSRVTALWTAAAISILFALMLGAVILRPALSVDADIPEATGQPGFSTNNENGFDPVADEPSSWDDDDDYPEHGDDGDDDHDDDDHDEGEHEDHDEEEDDDD